MSKFCTSCGRRLKDIDKVCSTCGTRRVVAECSSDTTKESTHQTSSNTFSKDKVLEKELGKVGFKSGALGGFMGGGLLSAISGGFGGKLGASWAASKLKTDEVHDKVSLQKNLTTSMTIVIRALSSMGTIIDVSQYTNYHVVSACCGSGFANMNPAVICVEFVQIGKAQTDLHISGYAKEGLIKQKTAIKAISKLKVMISN